MYAILIIQCKFFQIHNPRFRKLACEINTTHNLLCRVVLRTSSKAEHQPPLLLVRKLPLNKTFNLSLCDSFRQTTEVLSPRKTEYLLMGASAETNLPETILRLTTCCRHRFEYRLRYRWINPRYPSYEVLSKYSALSFSNLS